MTKSQKKLAAVLSCGGTVMVLLLAAIHFLFSSMRSYELHLPDFGDLKGITLTLRDGEGVDLVDAYAEDVLFILKGNGRTTKTESIQDAPVNTDDFIKVDMSFWKGGAATLFVYQRSSAHDGEYFIEQPYNGIYEISGDEYHSIEKYVS